MGTNTLLLPQSWHLLGHVTAATRLPLLLASNSFWLWGKLRVRKKRVGSATYGSSGSYFETVPGAAFLVLRDPVQMKATEMEEWAREKPGQGGGR